MARGEERVTPPTDKKNEHVVQLSNGAIPEITPERVTNDHSVKGSAIDESFVAPSKAEPPVYGIVLETKVVHCNRAGGRVTMRAGKVISTMNFDLQHLARQGLKIGRHEPEAALPLDQIFAN